MLTETAPPTITTAMHDELARHMRLSSGFASEQDQEAESAFRAAISHLERVLGICLAPREFSWRGQLERDLSVSAPIAPVRALISVSRLPQGGTATPLEQSYFDLDQTTVRTRFRSSKRFNGDLEFVFEAGFGPDWEATPVDLRRAALILAAEYFDQRRATVSGREAPVSFGVTALIQPWRPIRLGAGAKR